MQQGGKLVGTGAVGNALQGGSVALSADGNTALVGGTSETFGNGGVGAVWAHRVQLDDGKRVVPASVVALSSPPAKSTAPLPSLNIPFPSWDSQPPPHVQQPEIG